MNSILENCFEPSWLEFIYSKSTIVKIEANQNVFSENDPLTGIYIVKEGKIKITMSDSNGRERLLRLAGNSDILGHRGLGGDQSYPISATTLLKSELIHIPLELFLELSKSHAKFSFELMGFFADQLRDSEQQSIHLTAAKKIAYALIKNYEVFGTSELTPKKLSFSLSRQDISNMAGTTYETTIRVITDLVKRKIIKTEKKDIYILNIKKLRSYGDT